MRILRHPAALDPADRLSVVAIGNFDGIHRGHQAIIARASAIAKADGAPLGAVTFEPHPNQIFHPEAPPSRLTPFRAKARRLEALGVDLLFVLHFDEALVAMSAEDFISEILVACVQARHVVVGNNFSFGNQRRGTPEMLTAYGARLGLGVTIMEPVGTEGGIVYSSTRIREHLHAGRMHDAAMLLGRPFEIEGRVEPGDRLGRTIGFPTANLSLTEYIRPALGIYAVRAGIERDTAVEWHDGVAYIGWRPTVGGTDLRLETYIFDFDGDLYGKHLRVALIDHLRPDRKFAGVEELKIQMAEDARQARETLKATPPLG
jgi:riboflavin kinase/FMN adenylyltransferase